MMRSLIAILFAAASIGALVISLSALGRDTGDRSTVDSVEIHLAGESRSERDHAAALPFNRAPARLRPPADGRPAGDGPLPDAGADGPTDLAIATTLRDLEAQRRTDANEQASLDGTAAAAEPFSVGALVVPVEFAASEELTYQVHTADLSACITVTNRFTGPLHGLIPYPGGSPSETIDNQTVYYPSTEAEDYHRLIFGRDGFTQPLRAGDPNVNDGAGVDISGLTVQSYFDAQSDGSVTITGTVAPWVAVPHSEAYYGIDQCVPGYSPRAIPDEQLGTLAELTVDAVSALIARGGEFATREYWEALDQDGDGTIDGVWVIHAGRGQEYGGGSEGEQAIWSRASALHFSDAYPEGFTVHDGGTPDDPADDLRIDDYTMLPEDSDLGVLVEEFGHSAFGVPDLYTTDRDSSNSVGWWAPMSSGIWGGELGGTRPVNMPLWFRTVADCGGSPCGWADPVAVVSHTTAGDTIVIGRAGEPAGGTVAEGPYAGQTIHEGIRIDLPTQVETVPNLAGDGGGAFSGARTGQQLTLTTPAIDLTGVSDPLTLTLGAHWSIPTYWGYVFVEAAVFDGPFVSLPDLDGHFTDDDPFGLNTGNGLTGAGEGTLRFDLSEFAGAELRLRVRYITYRGGPGTGVWIDDVVLRGGESDEVLVERFDDGIPTTWATNGWTDVPLTLRHPHHYLVEWRDDSGFDASLRGAYQTNYRDQDEWRVDRVAANVPGALVMYRNLKYPFSGALLNQNDHLPSWGAKYALLVVDQQSMPTLRPSGQSFSGALESLDAALALQDQPDFSLEVRDPETKALLATDEMSGARGVALFDDAFGATPGIRRDLSDPAAPVTSPWDADASVVLPSRQGRRYSTRLTDPVGEPLISAYGEPYVGPHVFGTGNPGDENVQFGVHVDVVDMADDGSWGAVRVVNRAVDYAIHTAATTVSPGDPVLYDVEIDNVGAVDAEVFVAIDVSYRVGGEMVPDHSPSIERTVPAGRRLVEGFSFTIDPETEADAVVITAVFDDGADFWERRLEIEIVGSTVIYLPIVAAAAPVGGGGGDGGGASRPAAESAAPRGVSDQIVPALNSAAISLSRSRLHPPAE